MIMSFYVGTTTQLHRKLRWKKFAHKNKKLVKLKHCLRPRQSLCALKKCLFLAMAFPANSSCKHSEIWLLRVFFMFLRQFFFLSIACSVHTKKWTNITLRKLSDRSNHAQSIECARVIVYFLYNLGCVTLDRSWFSRSKIIHCIHNSSSHQHQPAQPCVFAKNYDANIK